MAITETKHTTPRAPLSMGQRRELHRMLQALRREQYWRKAQLASETRRLIERIEADHDDWVAEGEPEYEVTQ